MPKPNDQTYSWILNDETNKVISDALFPKSQPIQDPIMERLDKLERKIDLMIAMMQPKRAFVDMPTVEEIQKFGKLIERKIL